MDHKILRHDARELPAPKTRWLPHAEWAKLTVAIRPDRKDWLLTFVRTGCRYGELHRITAADIDHENKRCQLTGYKGRGKRKEVTRWVPIAPDSYEALSAHAAATPRGPLFPHLAGCPLISPKNRKSNRETTCTCQSDFHRILRIACRRAKIGKVTPNDLRRTYCSWMARAGIPEQILKKLMGHSGTSEMITQVYLQLDVDEGHDAVARVLTEAQAAMSKLQALQPAAEPAKAPGGRRHVRRA